jgi:alpha-glucosidase
MIILAKIFFFIKTYKLIYLKVIITFIFVLFFGTINAQESTAIQVSTFSIEAPQLKATKKIWVYLPKDYNLNSKKKYSVIYMHDGQNLFDAKTSDAGEWNIDETLDSITAQVIIIGIENGREKRT